MLIRPEFFLNTRYGYARGKEPVDYVNNVLTYYEILIIKTISTILVTSVEDDLT